MRTKEILLEKNQVEVLTKPKIAFVGVGWIGRNRMDAIVKTNSIEPVVIADPNHNFVVEAKKIAPDAKIVDDIDSIFDMELDAVIIATPSALHAEQSIKTLEKGLPVFCQKPLGRNLHETKEVIETARRVNKLLGIDLSYRFVDGVKKIKSIIDNNELGKIYGVNLVFHNAYGPDKSWFYNPTLSGGGCVIDLGIHLVDLALWTLNFPKVKNVSGKLFANGYEHNLKNKKVEDYAVTRIDLENEIAVNLTCSWKISAGRDAIIEASFYGTKGGASMKNINGSFYDFITEKYIWTASEVISKPPENWGEKAAVNWIENLVVSDSYNPEIENVIKVAEVIDMIYERTT